MVTAQVVLASVTPSLLALTDSAGNGDPLDADLPAVAGADGREVVLNLAALCGAPPVCTLVEGVFNTTTNATSNATTVCEIQDACDSEKASAIFARYDALCVTAWKSPS